MKWTRTHPVSQSERQSIEISSRLQQKNNKSNCNRSYHRHYVIWFSSVHFSLLGFSWCSFPPITHWYTFLIYNCTESEYSAMCKWIHFGWFNKEKLLIKDQFLSFIIMIIGAGNFNVTFLRLCHDYALQIMHCCSFLISHRWMVGVIRSCK